MCLYILSSLLWCPLRFPHTSDVRFICTPSCLYESSCLIYQSESINRRRTDNTMAKWKSTKGQATYKTYTSSQRTSNTSPTKNRGELRCSYCVVFFGFFSSSCVPYATYDASNVSFFNVTKLVLVVKRKVGILCSHAISRTRLVWVLAHWNNNPRVYMLFDTDALLEDEFEDIKGAIRIRISKKNRQHNGQQKKYKKATNDIQNIHKKLKIE